MRLRTLRCSIPRMRSSVVCVVHIISSTRSGVTLGFKVKSETWQTIIPSSRVALGTPIECFFLPGVAEGDEQDGDKRQGPPEDRGTMDHNVVLVDDGPRIKEDHFDIEEHEKHGHNVEL